MNRLYAIGELLIDFQSIGHAGLKDTEEFVKKAGGAPANVAAQAAKLNCPASYLTKVGNDGFGLFLIESLDEIGVDTHFIKRSDDYPTSLAFVSIKEDGEREFSFYRQVAADLNILPSDFAEVTFIEGDILELGTVALASDRGKATHDYLIGKAKEEGALIAFDPNLRFNLFPDLNKLKELVIEYSKQADIMKIGKDELQWLFGEDIEEGISTLLGFGVKVLLLTDGSKGARLIREKERYSSPGYKVKAIDATGAGDSFFGAFLAKLMKAKSGKNLDGLPYGAMLDFACKAGAYTTTGYGAIPSMGNEEQIERKVS